MKLGKIKEKLFHKIGLAPKKTVSGDAKRRYLNSGRIPWTEGYWEYKYDYIGEVIVGEKVKDFASGRLPPGYGYRLDERAVEYPWFISRLKDDEKVLLDAGLVLNFHQIISAEKLRSRKVYICTLDYEGNLGTKPSPSYIYEDLRDLCFKDGFFDAICCISTLEHVGMDNTMLYTDDESKKESKKSAYLAVLKELSRVLKEGGTVYLTMPFGKHRDFGWFQVFDSAMVSNALDAFRPSKAEKTFFRYHDNQWNFSDEEGCRDGDFFDINTQKEYEKDYLAGARCVACLEMIK